MATARVRALTVGIDPSAVDGTALAERLRSFYEHATAEFGRAGYEVQTRRLTLRPIRAAEEMTRFRVVNQLATLTRVAEDASIRWTCVPFAMDSVTHAPEWHKAAIEVIRRFPRTFVNFIVAEGGKIYHASLPHVAQAILDTSRLSSNGFDNFRVGAGCNLAPNTPFFPFSFHAGLEGFSLAVEIIETALRALEALPQGADLEEKRTALIGALASVVTELDNAGRSIEADTGLEYKGLDISLAPFPDARRTLALLFARLGVEQLGHAGTVAVTSVLTNILKVVLAQAGARATGFNGVMFSPLEDSGLAAAANSRLITVEKLLGWSTVCGCGVDMVPIPGGVMREELAALILDTAALSTVLSKPLGVRVLPIPHADANEMTNFNHDFLVNTRVLSLAGQALPLGSPAGGVLSYLHR